MVSTHTFGSRTPSRQAETRTKPHFSPWTMEQAFFAVSGGITVDSSIFWPQPHLTFTPAGVLQLARAGVLPPIPTTTAAHNTKAKTDAIAIALVSLQALWFTSQALTRLAHARPLPLLETLTLTHLACTLAITLTWFRKPSSHLPLPHLSDRLTDLAALLAIDPHTSPTLNPIKNRLVYPIDLSEATQASTHQGRTEADHEAIAHLHTRANRALDHLRRRYRAAVISAPVGHAPPLPELVFREPLVVDDGAGWRLGSWERVGAGVVVLPAVVAALCGAVVLGVSWAEGVFGTGVEKEVWRAAGCVLVGAAVVGAVVRVTAGGWMGLGDGGGWRHRVVRVLVVGVVVPAFVCAKVFVWGEAFAALRCAPEGMYAGAGWARFVPHVG